MLKNLFKRHIITISLVLITSFAISTIYPLVGIKSYQNSSNILKDNQGNIIYYDLSFDDKYRFKTTINDVSKLYLKMLIASEDERFYYHLGVDPIAILRSTFTNLKGYNLSGGSTLAMQLSKIMDKKPRTIISKIKEIFQASFLTLFYGKDTILNMYLTLAPFGSNIEGISAASMFYFGHMPNNLTPNEAALLVALPKAPEALRPDRYKSKAKYYRDKVLKKAYKDGIISKDVMLSSLKEDVPQIIKRPQIKAYHLGQRAFFANKNLHQNKTFKHNLTSDIDPLIQNVLLKICESINTTYTYDEDLAIVVIDNRNNKLLGYIGSKDYKKSNVDYAKALRSTGSTLKPFIYALAFDKKIITPHSIIDDSKHSFDNWTPQNFNKKFIQNVSASQALSSSLNLPAIKILQALDPLYFTNCINKKDRILKYKGEANLSLATGGGEMSLIALTELYAALANNGVLNTVALFKDDSQSYYDHKAFFNYKLVSKDAANAVYNILKKVKRVDGFDIFNEISYKTGTSYNYIDAHALGSYGSITVGVRVGKIDGSSNAPHTGYTRAAPIVFDVLSKIHRADDIKKSSKYLQNHTPYIISTLNDDTPLTPAPLKITFPKDNSTVFTIDNKVYVEFEGGVEPYRLFVNDMECENSNYFYVKSFGECKIVAVDSLGNSAKVKIYVDF